MDKCDICEKHAGTLRLNGLVMCCGCEYDPSKRALTNALSRCNHLTEENKALKADRDNAISKMSKSWQHNSEDYPDLLSRFVDMAKRQFDENVQKESDIRALVGAIDLINDACISTYGHGVGKMLTGEDSRLVCGMLDRLKK